MYRCTFGPTGGHDKGRIMSAQLLHTDLAHIISNFRQNLRNFSFQCLFLIAARSVDKLSQFCFLNERPTRLICGLDELVFLVPQIVTRNNVINAKREPKVRCAIYEDEKPYYEVINLNLPSHLAHSFANLLMAIAAASAP